MKENFNLLTVFVLFASAIVIATWKKKINSSKNWSGPGGKKLAIKNKELHCQHCGCNNFRKLEGFINNSVLMPLLFGFWNRKASCYTCVDCGFIHWFIEPEEKIFREFEKDEL